MGRRVAWHYTTGEKFQKIVAGGYLDPKASVAPTGERKILWFSTNQQYEQTATKAVATSNGTTRKLSEQETRKLGGGLVRFGVPCSRLIAWPKVGRKAGMASYDIDSLERVGADQGADSRQWLGTFKRIRVSDCVIEVYGDDGWTQVQGA